MKKLKITESPKAPRKALKLPCTKAFDVDTLLKHIDPGTPDEAEEFVRGIYNLRRQDRDDHAPR